MGLVPVRQCRQLFRSTLAGTGRQGGWDDGIGDGKFTGLGGVQGAGKFAQRTAQVGKLLAQAVLWCAGKSSGVHGMSWLVDCDVASQYKYARAIKKILICDVFDALGEYHEM
jgi:hypothetical protein